jgi:hypothetical protein
MARTSTKGKAYTKPKTKRETAVLDAIEQAAKELGGVVVRGKGPKDQVSDDELFVSGIWNYAARKPLFEVIFPASTLYHRDVFTFMENRRIRADEFGKDGTTLVAYFEKKMEAKALRDLVNQHWPNAFVGEGPLHDNKLRKFA